MKEINIKEFFKKHLDKIILILIIAILAVIFYSYNLNMTWDSSEYIGLADYIDTEEMQEKWIGHRGIGFPWLIKLSQVDGIKSAHNLLNLMFSFYVVMIFSLYLVYKKLNKDGILKNIILILGFMRIYIYFYSYKSYNFWILSYCIDRICSVYMYSTNISTCLVVG